MFFGFDDNVIEQAAKAIKEGQTVAFPTETVYGLGANALDPEAVSRIFKAKGRPQDNPLIVHIADIEDMERYAYPTPLAYELAKRFWPGPLTIILKKKDIIPSSVSAGLDTVALRFPSNKIAQRLIRESGCPIAAPSANISGSPSPTTAEHVLHDYEGTDKIAGIIDGGPCLCGVESTVITLTTKPPMLLRPGFVTPEELMEFIPDLTLSEAVKNKLPEGAKAESPGMLHRHYAPKAETEGVRGSARRAAAYINQQSILLGKKCGVMCFDGEEKLFISSVTALSYGKEDSARDRAAKMFDALRELDKKNLDKIYIRITDDTGVGLAVFNRLLRACEFNLTNAQAFPPVFGITGLSGAGKTTVSTRLATQGYDHIDTDGVSRLTLDMGTDELVEEFSTDILSPDGKINRRALAERAFSSPEKTDILNRITHKYIMAEVARRLEENRRGYVPSLVDGAALIEAEADKLCDALVAVAAGYDTRLERIIDRDSLSEEQAEKRLAAQQPYALILKRADFVFENESTDGYEKELDRLEDFLNTYKI